MNPELRTAIDERPSSGEVPGAAAERWEVGVQSSKWDVSSIRRARRVHLENQPFAAR